MMKEPITQQHDFGCGVACVAFIADTPYKTIAGILGENQAQTTGFWCKELQTALNYYGLEYEVRYVKSHVRKRIYKDGTIVFIKRSQRYPYGHYLTYHRGKWMDPWINLRFDKDIHHAVSGFRKRLPGMPIYALLPA